MKKKEYSIGDTFQLGFVKLRVVKDDKNSCLKCFFNRTLLCGNVRQMVGSCFDNEREDGTNVIFVEVEE